MKTRKRIRGIKIPAVAAIGLSAVVLAAGPAAAADDSFRATTSDSCGAVNYVDYGPGAAGGGDNDDYLVIHDYCDDGHGVLAKLWWYDWDGHLLVAGRMYNGNGLAGSAVVWDPFKDYGNVTAGQDIELEACLVDGVNDDTGTHCQISKHVSKDG